MSKKKKAVKKVAPEAQAPEAEAGEAPEAAPAQQGKPRHVKKVINGLQVDTYE